MKEEKDIIEAFEGRKNVKFFDLDNINAEVVGGYELGKSPPMADETVNELIAWGGILNALKDGLPLPNDPTVTIRKIERLEEKSGLDYSKLKECCSGANEVRDAKDVKPYFFAILERVVEISGIKVETGRY